MWCMSCFQSPHHPRCPKSSQPIVAFYCDRCSRPVHEFEVEDNHYVVPEGGVICNICVDTMSAREVLEFLGCFKRPAVA